MPASCGCGRVLSGPFVDIADKWVKWSLNQGFALKATALTVETFYSGSITGRRREVLQYAYIRLARWNGTCSAGVVRQSVCRCVHAGTVV